MKKLLFTLLVSAAFCCVKKEEKKAIATTDPIEAKTVETPNVGADSDNHGCKPSAGYTWSGLKKECVRLFEAGTRLDPYVEKPADPTAVMSAFVIFDGDNAELFLPSEKPIMLTRKSEGDSFVNGDWQLIPWKGYVLKKADKIMFAGQ